MSSRSVVLTMCLMLPVFGKLVVRDALVTPCPSTKLYYSNSVDAAGAKIWNGPIEGNTPGTCYGVGAKDITAFKFCGPGTFTLSRMTCQNHQYKADTVTHPDSVFTKDKCQ